MTTKLSTLTEIHAGGIVLILRLASEDEVLRAARAAVEGGVRVLEVPLTVPGALHAIETLATEFGSDGIVVGAGTVLDAQDAHSSAAAGARLLVSPHLSRDMLAYARRHQLATISGALTPTEIVDSLEAGADVVKLFPAELADLDYARAVLAPLRHAPLLPAGGVTTANVGEWFAAGVAAVGVGSAITKAARPDGDYGRVTIAARQFLAAVTEARAR